MNPQPIHVVALGGTLRRRSTTLLATERALAAAARAGASTDLIDLREQGLPFYEPGRALDDYPEQVADLIERLGRADALLFSSAAYHGTLAGITKNALDFAEFLSGGERPYLDQRVVGLIATAGGDMAQVQTLNAMNHIVHSLRGIVAPLQVGIPNAGKLFAPDGSIVEAKWEQRLDALGTLVVEMATRVSRQPLAL